MAVGATGCRVVDKSVRDADAHFRIGWWALSEIAFDSVRVEFRAQAGRVPYTRTSPQGLRPQAQALGYKSNAHAGQPGYVAVGMGFQTVVAWQTFELRRSHQVVQPAAPALGINY